MSVYSDIEYIACLDHNNIVCLFLQRLSVKVYIITTFNRCIDHISFVTINNGILIHVWIWYDVKNRSWRYCNGEPVTRDVFLISATYWDCTKSNAPFKQHQHSLTLIPWVWKILEYFLFEYKVFAKQALYVEL